MLILYFTFIVITAIETNWPYISYLVTNAKLNAKSTKIRRKIPDTTTLILSL